MLRVTTTKEMYTRGKQKFNPSDHVAMLTLSVNVCVENCIIEYQSCPYEQLTTTSFHTTRAYNEGIQVLNMLSQGVLVCSGVSSTLSVWKLDF